MPSTKRTPKTKATVTYQHPEAGSPMRPEIGTQAQFKKKKAPKTYRYDSSLAPVLGWDGQNPAREPGEAQLSVISYQLSDIRCVLALRTPKSLSKPFLNWSGKAERLSFDVPTRSLFIHERLSARPSSRRSRATGATSRKIFCASFTGIRTMPSPTRCYAPTNIAAEGTEQ
jgi:adenine-specific DNA-methyltransferase